MKKLHITIAFILMSMGLMAQGTQQARFNLLLDELRYIRDSLNMAITDLSVTHDMRWLITYGQNSYSYLGIPTQLQKRLKGISSSDEKILSADLLGDSSWVVITDKDKVYFYGLNDALLKAFEVLDRRDARVNFMRVWDGQFIIFYNKYKFLSMGISKNIYRSLNRLIKKGKLVKDIEIHGDAFVILFGHKGIMGYKVPEKLKDRLYRLQQRARTIDLIRRLPDGKWIIIFNKNQYLVI